MKYVFIGIFSFIFVLLLFIILFNYFNLNSQSGKVIASIEQVSQSLSSIPSDIAKARCPRFIDYEDGNDLTRYGKTWNEMRDKAYDGFLPTKGLQINEISSGDEFLYYINCTENLDGSVTFEKPYFKDGNFVNDIYPKSINKDGIFLAGSLYIDWGTDNMLTASIVSLRRYLLIYFPEGITAAAVTTSSFIEAVNRVPKKFCNEFGLIPTTDSFLGISLDYNLGYYYGLAIDTNNAWFYARIDNAASSSHPWMKITSIKCTHP